MIYVKSTYISTSKDKIMGGMRVGCFVGYIYITVLYHTPYDISNFIKIISQLNFFNNINLRNLRNGTPWNKTRFSKYLQSWHFAIQLIGSQCWNAARMTLSSLLHFCTKLFPSKYIFSVLSAIFYVF